MKKPLDKLTKISIYKYEPLTQITPIIYGVTYAI